MADPIARISTLVGDPNRQRFSAVDIAGAYDAASARYRNEENKCYSAAVELLSTDIQRLLEENAMKKDGTGVESTEMQDLSAIISARKAQISYLNSAIVTEKQIGSICGFGMRAARTILPGIND